jgi:16S rRNA processing protein RimM
MSEATGQALVVGRIVRPHGLRGEVSVEIRTDAPGHRFAVGSVLGTDPAAAGPLTVAGARWHTSHLLIRFAGIADRDQADPLRGVWLTVDPADVPPPEDDDEFYDHQLVGLTVVTVSGEPVGAVTDVLHHGQDLLVIQPVPENPAGQQAAGGDEVGEPVAAGPRRGEMLVPFVAAIAVEVDLAAGKLVIDPPPGLLELSGEVRDHVRRGPDRRARRARRGSRGARPESGTGQAQSGAGQPGAGSAPPAPGGAGPGRERAT